MPLFVTAYLCLATLAPAQCSRATALDVIPLGTSANELSCQRDVMQTLAGLAITAEQGAYWKVTCQRTSIGQGSAG